ncbi:MAG: phosphatase PAP2 family protein [Solirubrobacteraceae bacterium]
MSRASASAPEGASLSPDAALLALVRARGEARCTQRFSLLGEHAAIWLAYGAWRAARADDAAERSVWMHADGAIARVYAVNTVLKLLVRRQRPPAQLTGTPTQLSFPSAHAATSFAAARAFSRAGAPASPLYALAFALSLSRLRLGVHHPSDVLAGALLGTVLLR